MSANPANQSNSNSADLAADVARRPRSYPAGGNLSLHYKNALRALVLERIVERASAGAPWKKIWAGPMRIHEISEAEVEAELAARNVCAEESKSNSESTLNQSGNALVSKIESLSADSSAADMESLSPDALTDLADSPSPDTSDPAGDKAELPGDDFPWQDPPARIAPEEQKNQPESVPPLPGSPEAASLRHINPARAAAAAAVSAGPVEARQMRQVQRLALKQCVFCKSAMSQGSLSCKCRSERGRRQGRQAAQTESASGIFSIALPPSHAGAQERRLMDRLADTASVSMPWDESASSARSDSLEATDLEADHKRCPRCDHKIYRLSIGCPFCHLDFSIQPEGATPPPSTG